MLFGMIWDTFYLKSNLFECFYASKPASGGGVSMISKLVVILAVGVTEAPTEQYFVLDSSIADSTAFSETLRPYTIW